MGREKPLPQHSGMQLLNAMPSARGGCGTAWPRSCRAPAAACACCGNGGCGDAASSPWAAPPPRDAASPRPRARGEPPADTPCRRARRRMRVRFVLGQGKKDAGKIKDSSPPALSITTSHAGTGSATPLPPQDQSPPAWWEIRAGCWGDDFWEGRMLAPDRGMRKDGGGGVCPLKPECCTRECTGVCRSCGFAGGFCSRNPIFSPLFPSEPDLPAAPLGLSFGLLTCCF